MSNILTLRNPILINGGQVSELTYDANEITAKMFAEADMRKLSARTSSSGTGVNPVAEADYSFELYLGFAAIVAVNSHIDISDLERIKGIDLVGVMRIGRNFILGREEPSSQNDSDVQFETTQEPLTSPSNT